jgi:ABC-type nitrate/sulfonate/bicarbonate transport system substrate-binding protein
MQFTRNQMMFAAVIGLALLLVCVSVGIVFFGLQSRAEPETIPINLTTPSPTTQLASEPTEALTVSLESPPPIFAPTYDPGDGLPTYICGADAFGSYFTLQQMQMSGKDVEHGFHLGLVPFLLDDDPAYDVSEEQRTALLNAGNWDCLLTTLDSVALTSPGVITAIVDESAGADQLWGRGINTINDLSGKRITFSEGSVGEYFVYYTLSIARLNPRFDVTLLPQASVADAVAAFNAGQADAVSGWEPDIYEAEQGGGTPLLSSNQVRIVVDVIVTSRQSIANKPDLVQAFHDSWFDTLKDQMADFDAAAAQIAKWGHNDWSFVYPDSASADFRLWLESVAQADLADNALVMAEPEPIINRLEIARRVWAASGAEVPNDTAADLVNAGFVSRAASQPNLQANGRPINDTFSISAKVDLSGVDTNDAVTLAVLPCRRFSFVPESTELTLESRRILDDCVVPTLQQSVSLFLRVKGSSAWPGPPGTYTEAEILEFAEARAQSVVDYLVSQGIDPTRFIVEATLPPEERRETEDPEQQAEDRYVEMTLITVGR